MHAEIENGMVVDSESERNAGPIPAVRCDCGCDISVGETYWKIDGSIYCKECIQEHIEDYLFDFKKVVE